MIIRRRRGGGGYGPNGILINGFDFDDDDDDDNLPDNIIKRPGCDEFLDRSVYPGPVGTKFRISCPKLCDTQAKTVIGHEVYHYQSSICLAAVHGGFIKNQIGGKLEILFIYFKVR